MTHPSIHARTQPDKPAYMMAETGEAVTYGELDARANQGAQLFRSLGIATGDHIALMSENNLRFLEICWAAQRSGLYYTAISSRLTAPEVAYILRDCGAKLFIASKALEDVAQALRADGAAGLQRLMTGGTSEGYTSWEEARERQPATPIADQAIGNDMLYSSGTTGRPKGIKTTFAAESVHAPGPLTQMVQALYGMSNETIYLSPAPLYHAAPLRYNMSVAALGGTSIIMEHFDAEEYLRLVEKHRVTHTQLVPTMFVRMLKLPEAVRRRYDLSSLRGAIHAAAPCPVQVKQAMIDWWGPVIYEYYAGSEGNGFTSISSEEWLRHKGSVGRPIIGEVHIVGEDGEELPPREPGMIYFGGGREFVYHNDPGKTAQAYNDKGWSTLGDVGYLDEEGYLYLTDRKAYMIISGGVNIYPQETEDLLVSHPDVVDVAVFGVPNEDFGEEVKAVVQPRDMALAGPALEAELIAYCRERLSPIKCPRSVDFEAELPRAPTGKLYKRLLRDRYWAGHASRIV